MSRMVLKLAPFLFEESETNSPKIGSESEYLSNIIVGQFLPSVSYLSQKLRTSSRVLALKSFPILKYQELLKA